VSSQAFPLPAYQTKESPFTQRDVRRHRALLAFMLRAWGCSHLQIAKTLNLPGGPVAMHNRSREMVAAGRRVCIDCSINTVAP
jgi:hypothetical protein